MTNILLHLHCLAIVTLRNGEEAEDVVIELNGKRLLDTVVQVSVYRNDNLLCITNLPLYMNDEQFREMLLPLGQLERCFIMRSDTGELLYIKWDLIQVRCFMMRTDTGELLYIK